MGSRQSFTTALAVTLALGPIGDAAPPASARQGSPTSRATVVRVDEHSGFDWADAGIGAAGGIALSALGAGVALLVTERRRPIDGDTAIREEDA